MAKKHTKQCSPFLAIKEMQIKVTLRFYLIAVRMPTIKNTNTTNIGEDMEKKETSYTVGETVN
jgi:hypothetical protein